jgi:hypothetical protein
VRLPQTTWEGSNLVWMGELVTEFESESTPTASRFTMITKCSPDLSRLACTNPTECGKAGQPPNLTTSDLHWKCPPVLPVPGMWAASACTGR